MFDHFKLFKYPMINYFIIGVCIILVMYIFLLIQSKIFQFFLYFYIYCLLILAVLYLNRESIQRYLLQTANNYLSLLQ